MKNLAYLWGVTIVCAVLLVVLLWKGLPWTAMSEALVHLTAPRFKSHSSVCRRSWRLQRNWRQAWESI